MSKAKRALIILAAVLALGAGALAVLPQLLWGDGKDWSSVASIKGEASYQDPALLEKAWALPVAQTYRAGLDFQNNGSFCGPTSLVNVARSLGRAADQSTMLADTGTTTFFGVLPGGLTLDQLAEIARKKLGGRVTVVRDIDLAAFRAQLARANDPAVRMVVNFTRGPLFAGGGGHHSPIAGWLAEEDLVLVLDVNQKYRPWLVSSARLFEAMDTIDKTAGKKRGLLVLEAAP